MHVIYFNWGATKQKIQHRLILLALFVFSKVEEWSVTIKELHKAHKVNLFTEVGGFN